MYRARDDVAELIAPFVERWNCHRRGSKSIAAALGPRCIVAAHDGSGFGFGAMAARLHGEWVSLADSVQAAGRGTGQAVPCGRAGAVHEWAPGHADTTARPSRSGP